ncbi:MAG TPA: hypothetical protein V6D12_13015 [Candidatus Obscuribacterales bacterium]
MSSRANTGFGKQWTESLEDRQLRPASITGSQGGNPMEPQSATAPLDQVLYRAVSLFVGMKLKDSICG